jgi:hypothetical protein
MLIQSLGLGKKKAKLMPDAVPIIFVKPSENYQNHLLAHHSP